MRSLLHGWATSIAAGAVALVAVPVFIVFLGATWAIEQDRANDVAGTFAEALTVASPLSLSTRIALLDGLSQEAAVTLTTPAGATLARIGPTPGPFTFVGRAPTGTGLMVEVRLSAAPFLVPIGTGAVTIVALGLLASLIAANVGDRQVRTLTSALGGLVSLAEEVGGGGRLPPHQPTGIAEFDRIQEVLVVADARAEARVQLEQRIVSEISHSLRSPLTALSLLLNEMAMDTHIVTGEPTLLQARVRRALRQVMRLRAAIDDVLVAHRGIGSAEPQAIDIDTLIAVQLAECAELAATTGRRLCAEGTPGLVAWSAPRPVEHALNALLHNALRHGSGTVTVSTGGRSGWIAVDVIDEGGPIPEDLALFTPGVSTQGSSGLGCASARALVESAGGRLTLHRRRPTTFRILLPSPPVGTAEPPALTARLDSVP